MVLPVFVCVVLFFALLIAYPWWVLTLGTLAYLASVPFGWLSYRGHERKAAAEAAAAQVPAPAGAMQPVAAPSLSPAPDPRSDPDRPARLN
jgi:CDP-diacylglycerol--serine O-phosphatidyltransferase